MSRILPLPADAVSQIHSSKNITSLQDVVLALLENSLDAGATKIEITIDLLRGGCTVEDDGSGIPAAEFGENGGLGKMYHTSKRSANFDHKHDLHGWNGTYLASLAALSLLSITSTQVGCSVSSNLTMHQGEAISRQTSNASSELTGSAPHGTQVTVRDLFGNMPVRVKQRAMASENGSDNEKPWQQLKYGIAALLLAWPQPCAVRLSDLNRPDRKVHLAGSHPSVGSALTKSGLRQLESGRQSSYGIKEALPVLFQAGVASPEARADWIPVFASAVDVTVKGLINLTPAPTKHCQFISLGFHPCGNASGSGNIYDAINKVFANSNFGAAEEFAEIDDDEKDRRKRDRRFKGDGYTQKQLHGRKGVDRWPMFVLQVKFRGRKYTHSSAENLSDTTLKGIVQVLEATVTQWLTAHHFRPRKKRGRPREDEQGPASAASERAASTAGPHAEANATPDVSTLNRKRPITAQSAVQSKRSRTGELPERPHSMEQATATRTDDCRSPFRHWSRIKTGKQAESRKGATAPESQIGTLLEPAPSVRVSAFSLPPVEARALSEVRRQHARLHPAAVTPALVRPMEASLVISSEGFGSIDDEEMAAVAVEVEGQLVEPQAGWLAEETCPDKLVDWIDPRSKQKYQVNARTGVVLPARPKAVTQAKTLNGIDQQTVRHSAAINTTVSSAANPLSLAKRRPTTAGSAPADAPWLPGFLQQWNNPVFSQQDEQRIPVVFPDGPEFEAEAQSKHKRGHHFHTQGLDSLGAEGTARLKKSSLRSAKAIKQVDRKFILCAAPTEPDSSSHISGRTLILIDQHAASERVILEDLLADLCSPSTDSTTTSDVKTGALANPSRFQISATEHGLFEAQKRRFARWGILYHLTRQDEDVSTSQDVRNEKKKEHLLIVTHLPPAIAERCTLVPRVLIEMLRSEIYSPSTRPTTTVMATNNRSLLQDTSPSPPHTGHEQRHAWLRHIGSCPRGILDLVNSRACRSAIMFNDVLSAEECGDLVRRLAECAFPFTCAHGRVSMVPLGGLGGEGVAENGHIDRIFGGATGVQGGTGVLGGGGAESAEFAPMGEGRFRTAFEEWMRRAEGSAGMGS